jgi:hypothetical protein
MGPDHGWTSSGAATIKLHSPLVDIFKVSNFLDEQDEAMQTAVSDRRRSARETRMAPAWLSEQSGSSARKNQQQVTVVDLSLHGVGFIASTALEVQAAHWIVIATGSLHLSTRLRIINCRQREDGTWLVGGEFY